MPPMQNSEAMRLYECLKANFDLTKVKCLNDRLLFEVTIPIQVNTDQLTEFFKHHFKLENKKSTDEPQIQITINAGPPLIIEEITRKDFQIFAGRIVLNMVKNRREVEKIAQIAGLDVNESDFPRCLKHLCGEMGYDRLTFDKRVNTHIENVEENLKKNLNLTDFPILKFKKLAFGGLTLIYQEIRTLSVMSKGSQTTFSISIKDLFADNGDIMKIFDWFIPSEKSDT